MNIDTQQDEYGHNHTIKEILENNLKLSKLCNPNISFDEQIDIAEEWTTDDLFYSLHDIIFKMRANHLKDKIA